MSGVTERKQRKTYRLSPEAIAVLEVEKTGASRQIGFCCIGRAPQGKAATERDGSHRHFYLQVLSAEEIEENRLWGQFSKRQGFGPRAKS